MSTTHKWIQHHFKELVDQYAGKYVAVVDTKVISVGHSPKQVEDEARKKKPGKKLSVILVPKREDLHCLL